MVPIPEGSETHSEESSSPADYGEMQEMLDQPSEMLTGSGAAPGQGESNVAVEEQMASEGKKVSGACELSG